MKHNLSRWVVKDEKGEVLRAFDHLHIARRYARKMEHDTGERCTAVYEVLA